MKAEIRFSHVDHCLVVALHLSPVALSLKIRCFPSQARSSTSVTSSGWQIGGNDRQCVGIRLRPAVKRKWILFTFRMMKHSVLALQRHKQPAHANSGKFPANAGENSVRMKSAVLPTKFARNEHADYGIGTKFRISQSRLNRPFTVVSVRGTSSVESNTREAECNLVKTGEREIITELNHHNAIRIVSEFGLNYFWLFFSFEANIFLCWQMSEAIFSFRSEMKFVCAHLGLKIKGWTIEKSVFNW